MDTILQRAQELFAQTCADRRKIHAEPELGMDTPETVNFIMQRLTGMGYQPQKCGKSGVAATVGQGNRTFLLRADMDALPMTEDSGLPFASKITNRAHACGHDCHTAMLLAAAQILKEREAQLEGMVKLMFQPGEEIFSGCQDMIEAGILENPKVDAAMAMHVFPMSDVGFFGYRHKEIMSSVDTFKITIHGVGCHGAQAFSGVDPINIGAHVHLALQELIAREIDANEMALLTIGQFTAGEASNIIPQTAVLQGTIRTLSEATRTFLVQRLQEITEGVAKTFRGRATIEFLSKIPANFCNVQEVDEHIAHIKDVYGEVLQIEEIQPLQGSEDFALITRQVPSVYFVLGAGFPGEDKGRIVHNPAVLFNEAVLPYGAAVYVQCAENWLKTHK